MRKPRLRRRDLARAVWPAATPINPGRPDAERAPRLPLAEIPPREADLRAFVREGNDYLRLYRLGECSVVVTREFGRWHLSIAHPARYPTWDEIGQARYRILPPGIWVAQYLPPASEYVNLHRHCFQLFECEDPETG